MQKYKDIKVEKKTTAADRQYMSRGGKEDQQWNEAEFYLQRADGDDFDKIEKNYCSLGPDGFHSVGPTHGPFHEKNQALAKKMFASATAKKTEEYLMTTYGVK